MKIAEIANVRAVMATTLPRKYHARNAMTPEPSAGISKYCEALSASRWRLGVLRLLHQIDDLSERGVGADGCGSEPDAAAAVDLARYSV